MMDHNYISSRIRPVAVNLFVIVCLLYQSMAVGAARANPSQPLAAVDYPGKISLNASPILAGCSLFPADNIWNAPIDSLPLASRSNDWINTIGRSTGFHMDFGSGTWDGGPIGIPYNIVDESVPKVAVDFYYSDESDPGPYPIPANPLIEYGSDHHLLILDSSSCMLYEIFDASCSGGAWHGGSGAIWDLCSNALRPAGWTSADAAGLPILPGLVRYDEIVGGAINHALRFTASQTNGYFWPARHLTMDDPSAPQIPPMGARFRLKASYDISGFPAKLQIILKAMKTYGIILADNGSDWSVSGAPDERWDNDLLHQLNVLTGDDFEAVDTSVLMVDPDSGQARYIGFPIVTTAAVTNITETAAQSGGNVTSDGGTAVTARGVCWSTTENPTTADSNSVDGSGTGTYMSYLIGLSPKTTYHVRAYAMNSLGTGYGSDVPFATLPLVNINDDLLGTWDSSGVWYRNTETGAWVSMTTPASLIAAGDIDGDSTDDLIGVWTTGLWIKSSRTKTWAKLSSNLPTCIACGDMNGDGRDDVVGSWTSGVWYRNSMSGTWVIMSSTPASQVAAGDADGDAREDLIGVWTTGLWVKKSTTGTWIKITANLPTDIAAGEMSGDTRADILGTWSSGVWNRNSATGAWVLMSSTPASLIAAGDIDGDAKRDLIGVWTTGVWLKKSKTSGWTKITANLPRDIDAGLFRTGETADTVGFVSPLLIYTDAPGAKGGYQDLSNEGPGGWKFRFDQEENLIPFECDPKFVLGPGDPGLQFEVQESLVPQEKIAIEQKRGDNKKLPKR